MSFPNSNSKRMRFRRSFRRSNRKFRFRCRTSCRLLPSGFRSLLYSLLKSRRKARRIISLILFSSQKSPFHKLKMLCLAKLCLFRQDYLCYSKRQLILSTQIYVPSRLFLSFTIIFYHKNAQMSIIIVRDFQESVLKFTITS